MEVDGGVVLGAGPAKIGFRGQVREYIRAGGVSGVSHRQIMVAFGGYPVSKVTIALNELLARREAYLRSGIYRLTTRIDLAPTAPT